MKTRMCRYSWVAITVCAIGGTPSFAAQSGAASKERTEEAATLEQLRHTRDALSAVTEYKAALRPAEEVIAELEGRQDVDMSDDLLSLASIQAGLEDYDAAELSYLRAIEILEHERGMYSPRLIAPYHALGRAYTDSGHFDKALVALKRAQWISKRSQGLFNPQQSTLIDDMTTAQLESGDLAEARALQLERLDNAIRQFGPDSPELVPFYRHLGDYYEQWSPRLFNAREQFTKALEISDAHFGDASPQSLDLLRRLTELQMKLSHRTSARDQLLAALDKATDVAPEERGLSLAVLGDWAIVTGDQASANRYYSEAYDVFQESDAVDADHFFAAPMMLDFVPPLDFYDARNLRLWDWGKVEFAFDVSASGQASDVRMVSVEPGDDDVESDYGERIRATHFRPTLMKGHPVASSDVSDTYRFRHYFRH